MRVSIGITAYNAEATIARAITSAASQTWPDCELLIVDDASTDSTWTIVQNLAAQYPKTRAFKQDVNAGVAAARNRLIAEAEGTHLAFFDDDDVSHPERVKHQMERLLAFQDRDHNGYVACYTARRQVWPDGRQSLAPTLSANADTPASGRPVIDLILTGRPLRDGQNRPFIGACATCSLLAPLNTLRELGGFDANFRRSEDTEFNLRLALAGGSIIGIPEPLVTQTMTSANHKSLPIERDYTQKFFDKHVDAFPSPRWARFMDRWIDLRLAAQTKAWSAVAVNAARLVATQPDLLMRKLGWLLQTRQSNAQ